MSEATVGDVAKAQKKAMSPDDIKRDMKFLLGPHMNWHEMLNPAPLSICLLGQLVLITLDKDVSFVSDNMDINAFIHIRHPESLSTCMVQVANQGWTAFNTANKIMDEIRLLTLQVPQHIKNAVKFIIGGSNKEIEKLVPTILSNVTRISETCTEKAQTVETQFTNVIELIDELQEACTKAKEVNKERLRKTKSEAVLKMKRLKKAEANKKEMDDVHREMTDHMKKARKSFEKAMEEMPTVGELICTKIIDDLGKALTGSVAVVCNAVTMRSLRRQPTNTAKAKDDILLASELETLAYAVQQLNEIASKGLKVTPATDLVNVTASFHDVTGELKAYTGKAKKTIADITKDGSELCLLLTQYRKQMNISETEEKTINDLSTRLDTQMKQLQVFCTRHLGGSPMANPTPRVSAMEQRSSDSVTDACKQNCQFKVNQASSHLEAARQDFQKSSERAEQACQKVDTLVDELAAMTFDKVDFEEIKGLLRRGIKALGEVKTQWGKLVRFFQTMTNLIKCCLEENVKNFVQSAEIGKEFRLEYNFSDMLKDMMFTQASEANKIAFMVSNLSAMYVEVSEKHIMDQVASLGQLVAFDAETEKHLIRKKQLDLSNQAKEASSDIIDIVRRKRMEFDTEIQKRIKTIETEMRAVLPPPKPMTPEVEAKIKRAIQDAEEVKKEEQEEDDWIS